MNERQQAAFLWQWSRRRRLGLPRLLIIGAGIGALGGLAFAVLMYVAMTANGGSFSLNEDEIGGLLLPVAQALGPTGFLFAISIPMFAGLGLFLAFTVGRRVEGTYQSLLDGGAQVPETKPPFSWKDRAPGLAVIAGFILLLVWMLVMLWWEIGRGNL